jgi:hypothetical protein
VTCPGDATRAECDEIEHGVSGDFVPRRHLAADGVVEEKRKPLPGVVAGTGDRDLTSVLRPRDAHLRARHQIVLLQAQQRAPAGDVEDLGCPAGRPERNCQTRAVR